MPAFIATLTMLLHRPRLRARRSPAASRSPIRPRRGNIRSFFHLGETNVLGFNNQILDLRSSSPSIGALVLAKTRWGYETFATGGNEQAAIYAGIPTRWVRIRAYLHVVALRDARRR